MSPSLTPLSRSLAIIGQTGDTYSITGTLLISEYLAAKLRNTNKGSGAPSGGTDGDIYFDESSNKIYIRLNGAWKYLTLNDDITGVTIEEADGTPSVANFTKIKVGNGDLTDEGSGVVRLQTASDVAVSSAVDVAKIFYWKNFH